MVNSLNIIWYSKNDVTLFWAFFTPHPITRVVSRKLKFYNKKHFIFSAVASFLDDPQINVLVLLFDFYEDYKASKIFQ
jgi:hypothetical protein